MKCYGGAAVLIAATALSGCDGTRGEVLTPGRDASVSDLPGDSARADDAHDEGGVTDDRASPMDAAEASAGCRGDGDCAGDPVAPVCEPVSGRCVACRPDADACPADRHCDPIQRLCLAGCRSDEGCAAVAPDGGVAGDGGGAAGVCDTAVHRCVQCRSDGDCPAGLLCAGQRCVPGCSPTRACPGAGRCCAGACVDLGSDPSNCGACGAACDVANATNGCDGGACTFTCDPGYVASGAACVSLPPPRPVAPSSTATVTSRVPTLRWALPAGVAEARVQVCYDRACSRVVATIDATGSRGAPSIYLPRGVLFWRVFGRAGALVGAVPSPTWEFTVGARSAPIDTNWGTVPDFNGDGLGDLAVGACGANGDAGRVYLFPGRAEGPAAAPAVTLDGPDGARARFGSSVASAGDVNGDGFADLVVGASGRDSAFIYLGGPAIVGTSPASALIGFGSVVAGAGDVNGDGYADVVVGSSGPRSVSVFMGSAGGIPPRPAVTLAVTDAAVSGFGASVAGVGDVNGDGYADVLAGARYVGRIGSLPYDNTFSRAYLYLGGAAGLSTGRSTTLTGPVFYSFPTTFPTPVSGAGDVNGDGYADAIAGGLSDWVHLGSADGLTDGLDVPGPRPSALYPPGTSMAPAGDVNGDGYSDVLIGYGSTIVNVYAGGEAGVGSPTNGTTDPTAVLTAPPGSSGFGRSVAGVGDVNGDGIADVAVGADGSNAAHLYIGSTAGLLSAPFASLVGPDGGSFGGGIARAWDPTRPNRARLLAALPRRSGVRKIVLPR